MALPITRLTTVTDCLIQEVKEGRVFIRRTVGRFGEVTLEEPEAAGHNEEAEGS